MNARLKSKGLMDDRGQALTEFAIIIPVTLLIFFSLLQILLIAQVSQLGNYAAFAAARTYAVRSGVDDLDAKAKDYAKKSAALVFAPVAGLIPGELADFPDAIEELVPEFDSGIFGNIAKLAMGFAAAYYIRMDEKGGGSFEIERGGSPEQVNVKISFGYPIFIPGLKGLWTIIDGERDLAKNIDTWGLKVDPSGIDHLNDYPYIAIHSKASVGYEPWSGEPRERNTVEAGTESDEELDKYQEKVDKLSEDLEDAIEDEDEAKDRWELAKRERDAAQRAFDDDPSDENRERLEAAKRKEQDAHDEYDRAVARRQRLQDEMTDLVHGGK